MHDLSFINTGALFNKVVLYANTTTEFFLQGSSNKSVRDKLLRYNHTKKRHLGY